VADLTTAIGQFQFEHSGFGLPIRCLPLAPVWMDFRLKSIDENDTNFD